MIPEDTRQAIITLHDKGMQTRVISLTLKVSRNTVRRVLRGDSIDRTEHASPLDEHVPLITQAYRSCGGNVVRVAEVLKDHGIEIPYSTLTRLVRNIGLRMPQKVRAGAYEFGPGEEMQHDTSPHKVIMDGKPIIA